jgi:hypothetical protein
VLTFQQGVDSNKCSKGLGFRHFHLQSAFNPLIRDYTKIFYMIDKGDIASIGCKMSLSGRLTSMSLVPVI